MSKNQEKAKTPKKTAEQNESKARSKNYEAYQHYILIYLLAKKGIMTELKQSKKKATQTKQLPTINKIIINEKEIIEMNKFVVESANNISKSDFSDPKKIRRRKERNRITIAFNRLFEISTNNKIKIHEKNTRKAENTIRMKKIEKVESESIIYQKDEISLIGWYADEYVQNHFENKFCMCGKEFLAYIDSHMNDKDKSGAILNQMKEKKKLTENEISETTCDENSVTIENVIQPLSNQEIEQNNENQIKSFSLNSVNETVNMKSNINTNIDIEMEKITPISSKSIPQQINYADEVHNNMKEKMEETERGVEEQNVVVRSETGDLHVFEVLSKNSQMEIIKGGSESKNPISKETCDASIFNMIKSDKK